MNIIDRFKNRKNWLIKRYYPFLWSRILYKRNLGKVANFNTPRDLNEKIQWLMFYTDTSIWSKLADKFAVRQYYSGLNFPIFNSIGTRQDSARL